VVKPEPATASLSSLLIVRILAFGVGIVSLLLAHQRKSRLVGVLAAFSLLVAMSTFFMGTTLEAAAQTKELDKTSSQSSLSQVEMGRQLFLAKGCITCHYNDRAANRSAYWRIEMGAPDLSNYSSSQEVLFIRLKDPAATKSDTKMPNLELKKTEIEALIAFINSK
jgi:cytochrome c2